MEIAGNHFVERGHRFGERFIIFAQRTHLGHQVLGGTVLGGENGRISLAIARAKGGELLEQRVGLLFKIAHATQRLLDLGECRSCGLGVLVGFSQALRILKHDGVAVVFLHALEGRLGLLHAQGRRKQGG